MQTNQRGTILPAMLSFVRNTLNPLHLGIKANIIWPLPLYLRDQFYFFVYPKIHALTNTIVVYSSDFFIW
jgi:hypothetical protein